MCDWTNSDLKCRGVRSTRVLDPAVEFVNSQFQSLEKIATLLLKIENLSIPAFIKLFSRKFNISWQSCHVKKKLDNQIHFFTIRLLSKFDNVIGGYSMKVSLIKCWKTIKWLIPQLNSYGQVNLMTRKNLQQDFFLKKRI